jgi:hypothetical protein
LASLSTSASGLPPTSTDCSEVTSLLPKAASATDCASSVKRALLATKSVSQFSSSRVPLVVPSSLAMTRPLLAARPSRFATPLRPLIRSCSTALS